MILDFEHEEDIPDNQLQAVEAAVRRTPPVRTHTRR